MSFISVVGFFVFGAISSVLWFFLLVGWSDGNLLIPIFVGCTVHTLTAGCSAYLSTKIAKTFTFLFAVIVAISIPVVLSGSSYGLALQLMSKNSSGGSISTGPVLAFIILFSYLGWIYFFIHILLFSIVRMVFRNNTSSIAY